jgi:hypothetical protein
MRRARVLFAAIASLALATGLGLSLTPGVANAAPTADEYLSQVVNTLHQNGHHVYVDAAASPKITDDQASKLESQIDGSNRPIFILMIDNAVTSTVSNPDAFLQKARDAFSAVGLNGEAIGVSTSKGFYANGYNLRKEVASKAGPLAKTAVNAHKNDAYGAYSQWVSSLAAIKLPPAAHGSWSAPAPSNKGSLPGWAILLIVLGGLIVLVLVIVLVVRAVKRRNQRIRDAQDNAERTRRIERGLSTLESDLLALQADVETYPNAKPKHTVALAAVSAARSALSDGDINDAENQYDKASRAYDSAALIVDKAKNPEAYTATTVHTVYAEDEEPTPRRRPRSRRPVTAPDDEDTDSYNGRGFRAQGPSGTTVNVNQTSYPAQSYQAPGYGHYYGGGMYGGTYWAPGWYSDPFWTWVMLDELNDHHTYERGFQDGERAEGRNNGGEGDNSSGTTGGASWGSDVDNSSDSGWGGQLERWLRQQFQ